MRKKEKDEGPWSACFYVGPVFIQTPVNLLRDPSIPAQAKALFMLYQSYSGSSPTEKTLADNLKMKLSDISRYRKVLEDAGWLSLKQRGKGLLPGVILHEEKQTRKKSRRGGKS